MHLCRGARGSAAVLGVAFVENICGNSGMAPLMIVSAVPMYNIISVIALTFGGNDRQRGTAGIKKAFVNILKNPIIIGILLESRSLYLTYRYQPYRQELSVI